MKTKVLGLFGLSIFLFALSMGAVSAVTVFSDNFDDVDLTGWTVTNDPTTLPGIEWNNTGTFAEAKPGNGSATPFEGTSNLSRTISTSGFQSIIVKYDRQIAGGFESDDNFKASWSIDGISFNIMEEVSTPGTDTSFAPKTFNLPSSADNNANFEIRFECTTDAQTESCKLDNVIIEGTAIPIQTEPPEVTACNNNIGNPEDNLNVKDIDFKNLGSLIFQESNGAIYVEFGDDDEWFPLDYIEVDIEIENNGGEKIEDIEVEWGLYDTELNEWVIDLDDEKDFNLKRNKEETLTISFQLEDDLDIDLDELGDDRDRYVFYVLATGFDNELEDKVCTSDSRAVKEIIIESDFVVLQDIEFPETVQCNAAVQLTAKVWNIGDSDQDEVKVEVHNSALGIFHKMIEIGDIDSFDDDTYDFNFKVPSDAEEKTHTLEFRVFDEDFDVYENDFDDDESKFFLPFRVSGGCSSTIGSDVSVSANLESGGRAGEELIVRATVTNNGNELDTFSVRALGFAQWASSFTVDKSSLVLDAGQSGDVVFTFDVNKDASGSQSFTIELASDNNQITTQPVSVEIEESGGFLGLTGALTGGNAYLWGIGALNIILVVIIIIVAVRVARR